MKKKKIKQHIINIKISSSFVIRDVCKYCGFSPSKYYYLHSKNSFKEISEFKEEDKFYSSFHKINYSIKPHMHPRRIVAAGLPEYSVTDKSYNISYYKIKRCNTKGKSIPKESSSEEYLSCKCGRTDWSFKDEDAKDRPEIINRQAIKKFPYKFTF